MAEEQSPKFSTKVEGASTLVEIWRQDIGYSPTTISFGMNHLHCGQQFGFTVA
jgi:hypothetical protein